MKITLVVATSQDGFINHIGEKHASDWTSLEDQKHFASILNQYKLLLMGLNTYLANKDGMKHSSFHHRVVFTHEPEKYKSLPGILEFTGKPIKEVVAELADSGYKHAVLVGGGILFTEFLKTGLVDEALVTIEPLTFGEGIPFLTGGETMQDFSYLKLEDTKTLNNKGTRLFRYVRG